MISPEVGAGWDPSRIESYASAESQERERRQQKAYEELCEMSTEGDGPASPAPAGLAGPSLGSSICHISPKDLHPTKFHAWMHSAEAENLNRRQHERFIDSAINRDQKRRVRLHYEGTLIRIDGMPGWAEYENEKAPKRGKIKEFSAKSRSRMMALVASLKASSLPQFVTLTYPREWVHDPRMWKVHLDTFRKWLSRSYPSASGIWKLEPQERGAPHFHLLVFGIPFLPWQIVAVRWAEIVSQSKLPKSFPVERGKRGAAIFREWISNHCCPRQA